MHSPIIKREPKFSIIRSNYYNRIRQFLQSQIFETIILLFGSQSQEWSQVVTVVTQVLLLDIIHYKKSFLGLTFHKILWTNIQWTCKDWNQNNTSVTITVTIISKKQLIRFCEFLLLFFWTCSEEKKAYWK